jgi:hypothetical protein
MVRQESHAAIAPLLYEGSHPQSREEYTRLRRAGRKTAENPVSRPESRVREAVPM